MIGLNGIILMLGLGTGGAKYTELTGKDRIIGVTNELHKYEHEEYQVNGIFSGFTISGRRSALSVEGKLASEHHYASIYFNRAYVTFAPRIVAQTFVPLVPTTFVKSDSECTKKKKCVSKAMFGPTVTLVVEYGKYFYTLSDEVIAVRKGFREDPIFFLGLQIPFK